MKAQKKQSIFLYKQKLHSADRKGNQLSGSKSRLKDSYKNIRSGQQSDRINPIDYAIKNKPHLTACNMEDPQIRIKRDHSPLYQRTDQQRDLFQKGLRKAEKNINLQSKLKITDQILQTNSCTLSSENIIKRQDPNKQICNIFELDKSPAQFSIRSRYKNKINLNKQSEARDLSITKSSIRDKNIQTQQTADYVIKQLPKHISNCTREVHLKFTKKQNIVNVQNLNNQVGKKCEQQSNKQHKRHYSHLTTAANKQNIERKQNGICIKETNSSNKLDFNHDFYKKEDRIINNTKNSARINTQRQPISSNKMVQVKTQHYQKCQSSRIGILRKKFL